MEKRKENARYLNQCFTMMVLLNCIIVLFLAFTIVLTQYRVAAAQEAQQFIETLKVMPERPEQKIISIHRDSYDERQERTGEDTAFKCTASKGK